MESTSEEVLVCQTCGAEGFTNAFIYCVKCLGFVIHRYCLDVIPNTSDEIVIWFCEDCKPATPYMFTSPKHDPSRPHEDDPTNSSLVKTTPFKKKRKKKRNKKRKIVHKETALKSDSTPNQIMPRVVLGLAKCALSEHEHVISKKEDASSAHVKTTPRKKKPKRKPKKKTKIVSSIEKEIVSGPNQITQCAELDNNCSPLKENEKRKTKKHKTQIEHSSCDSICTDVTSNDKEEVKHFEKELNKQIKDNNDQIETMNNMQYEQNMRVDRDGVDASRSADFEINIQFIDHQPAKPVLDPIWRGSFNIIGTNYALFEGFVGHLSSRACYKVCEEANTLPSLLSLQMQSKTDIWPKSFLESQPSDENIALYFFPGNIKSERDFEQLINDMIDDDLAMRATAKNAELLIFTSRVLPQSFWRFKGNYYLWGVFRGKRNDSSSTADAVSNTSDYRVASGKEIPIRVKTTDSGSPQSPLCIYRS